jgi:hypothetical protein
MNTDTENNDRDNKNDRKPDLVIMNTDIENNGRDNKNDRKPDPPGEVLFFHSYINTHFDSVGTMSAMTDPPLINFHNQDPPSNANYTQHVSVPSMPYSMTSTYRFTLQQFIHLQ